jgi:hypothetical protein
MTMPRIAICLPILGLTLLVGCAPQPVAVSGSVTLDGKPLDNVNLGFTPADGGSHAIATTDEEGKFAVDRGLLPGEYKVAVVANPPPFDFRRKAPRAPSPVPAKYSNPNTTPLRLTVPMQGAVVLELSSRP